MVDSSIASTFETPNPRGLARFAEVQIEIPGHGCLWDFSSLGNAKKIGRNLLDQLLNSRKIPRLHLRGLEGLFSQKRSEVARNNKNCLMAKNNGDSDVLCP